MTTIEWVLKSVGTRAGAPMSAVLPPEFEFPPFQPRFPWWGRDAQTLRNFLKGPRPTALERAGERLTFLMADGTGDGGKGRAGKVSHDQQSTEPT